jgi:hypothetical protein
MAVIRVAPGISMDSRGMSLAKTSRGGLMRATVALLSAAVLSIVVAAPRAGHCCGLAGRAAAHTALIVTASAGNGGARALSLRGPSTVAPLLPVFAGAQLDPRLPIQIWPTWSTAFGRAHAGFAIAGRF